MNEEYERLRNAVPHENGPQPQNPEPDWYERFAEWMEAYGLLVVFAVLLCGAMWTGIASCVKSSQLSDEADKRAASAIQEHMAWLRRFPDVEKRKWPVASYCRPGATKSGWCECQPEWGTAEVTWPERLENGDIACHSTK